MSARILLEGLAFPEGPRWHEGRLWFSDMHAHEIVAVDDAGKRETMLAWSGPVSGLGWLPDGRLLFVSMEDRTLMRREKDGRIALHGDLSAIATWHANDMVVDAHGRAYVGNFGFPLHPTMGAPTPATLARVDPDGAVHAAADDLMFPNGMVITPDGRTLIVGESFKGVLTAFDVGADGALSNRREWARLPQGAVPDGCCLDADGAIWVASPTTKQVLRVREGGAVLATLAFEQQAIACMLGGADGRTLYCLTSDSTDPDACKATRVARISTHTAPAARAGWP
jgi:sugar lactone lactonase YvrE